MIPSIANWGQFQHHLYQLESERGRDFALGVEIGFGEYESAAALAMRQQVLGHNGNKGIRNTQIAAGAEYGELLAEQADTTFQLQARQLYCQLGLSSR